MVNEYNLGMNESMTNAENAPQTLGSKNKMERCVDPQVPDY